VSRLRDFPGIQDIGMTSNGIVLGRKLDALIDAGLNRLNISLDTLNEAKYMMITRRNGFSKVLKLIEQAETRFERLKVSNSNAIYMMFKKAVLVELCCDTRLERR
jgi:molybdenum cofactor biosynthesis enzyme MoaA